MGRFSKRQAAPEAFDAPETLDKRHCAGRGFTDGQKHLQTLTPTSDSNVSTLSPLLASVDISESRPALEARIVELFRRVWLGLYRFQEPTGPRQADRVKALYIGAAGDCSLGILTLCSALRRNFYHHLDSGHLWNEGLAALKFYPNASPSTLNEVLNCLLAYEQEVAALEVLCSSLEAQQQPVAPAVDPLKWIPEYDMMTVPDLAEAMASRLKFYDARVDGWRMKLYEESVASNPSQSPSRVGRYVYELAFP